MNYDTPIIDAHALLGSEYHLQLSAPELLKRMDENDIQTAIARPVGAELAVYNTQGNDRVLKAGKRIRGMATVNPWFGAAALDELKRCRDLGAVGLFLHPSRQGFMPSDGFVAPIFDYAASVKWPVTVHTGSYVQADILSLGEVARKYPQTTFIAGFGGFTDMWFELPGVFSEVPNLVLDCSMIWGDAVLEIVQNNGAERVIFGSAEPRNRYPVALKMLSRLNLNAAQLRAILFDNARRTFCL
ncbi:MAG TPA: amidohydrolase family protein [Planctomycetota bacterium]|nr:amidohydrolase family protein [Planctomycetota bacterium]